MDTSQSEILTRRHQTTAAVILAVCLVLMAVSWVAERYRRERRIDIDRPYEVPTTELRIDINSAEWPELTLLPDISETMARRIVEYRELHGEFPQNADLQRVKGIGPRTFVRIEPYLLLPSDGSSLVEQTQMTKPTAGEMTPATATKSNPTASR